MVTLVAVAAVVAAAAAAGRPVYVTPQVDALHRADAIVVLGGDHDGREEFALDLAERGYAPRVLFSDPYPRDDAVMTRLCSAQRAFEISCFRPSPGTTRGEAREIRAQAAEHHWQHIIVVTFTPHVSRARYVIERCYRGDLMMAKSPALINARYWTQMYAYQTAGFIRAALQRGC